MAYQGAACVSNMENIHREVQMYAWNFILVHLSTILKIPSRWFINSTTNIQECGQSEIILHKTETINIPIDVCDKYGKQDSQTI